MAASSVERRPRARFDLSGIAEPGVVIGDPATQSSLSSFTLLPLRPTTGPPPPSLNTAMALNATLYQFELDLADADRGVYTPLSLRVARHPSEAEEYMLARVLAYCAEWTEGIAFSAGGLSSPDEPAIAVRDLTGQWQAWIDVGLPDAARLHRAAKSAPRVAVYCHRDPALLLAGLAGQNIHRAEHLALFALDRGLVDGLKALLARRMTWSVSLSGGHAYVTAGNQTLDGPITPLALPDIGGR